MNQKRDRDEEVPCTGFNSDVHIAAVFKYLLEKPSTVITLVSGIIDRNYLIRKGRSVPKVIRGFMRHSAQSSPRNLIFEFSAKLDGDDVAKRHRFHFTLTRVRPALLPAKTPSMDLVYIGGDVDGITDGHSGKAFQSSKFYNPPDHKDTSDHEVADYAEGSDDEYRESEEVVSPPPTKKAASATPKRIVLGFPQPPPTLPIHHLPGTIPPIIAGNSLLSDRPVIDARALARELFVREDPQLRQEAKLALLSDATLRAEARQEIFKGFEADGGLKAVMQQAYAKKFEQERASEKQQHQELLIKLEQDKQLFLEEHRKAIQEAQARILKLTADKILTDDRFKSYREAAVIQASIQLQKEPEIIAQAEKMARRAMLLDKPTINPEVPAESSFTVPAVFAVSPEDQAAANAFVDL
jgi:hypothetical protein